MKIAVAADHGGYNLKNLIKKHLQDKGIQVTDYGAHSLDKSDDYPDFAFPAAKSVAAGENDAGILVCSTGIGMSITANKIANIRAALVVDPQLARTAKSHNNANVIALPGNGLISEDAAIKIVDAYLETEFRGGRHKRRLDKINKEGRSIIEGPRRNKGPGHKT